MSPNKDETGTPAEPPKRKIIALNTPFKNYQSPKQIKPNYVFETPNYKLQEAMKRIKDGRSCFTPATDSGDDSMSCESSKHFSMLPHKRVDEKQTIKCYIFQIENKQHYFLSSVKHHSNVFYHHKLSSLDIPPSKTSGRFSADSNMEFTCIDRNPTIIKNENHTLIQTSSKQSSLQLSLHWSNVQLNEESGEINPDASPILKTNFKRCKAVRKLCDDLCNYPASQLINPINNSFVNSPLYVNLHDRKKQRRSVRSKSFKEALSNEKKKKKKIPENLSQIAKSESSTCSKIYQSALEKTDMSKLKDKTNLSAHSVNQKFSSVNDDNSLIFLSLKNESESLCSFNRATNNSFEDFVSPKTRKFHQQAKNKAAKYSVCIRVSQNIREENRESKSTFNFVDFNLLHYAFFF